VTQKSTFLSPINDFGLEELSNSSGSFDLDNDLGLCDQLLRLSPEIKTKELD
jgi:hypothetical protein